MIHEPADNEDAETPPPGMLEHPQYPGLFYDASIVYIRTGDAVKDAAHRLMMHEHSYCIPQTFIIGGAYDRNQQGSTDVTDHTQQARAAVTPEAIEAATAALIDSRLGDHPGINGEEFIEAAIAALEAAAPHMQTTNEGTTMTEHEELLKVLLDADEAHKTEGAMWPQLVDAILAAGYRKVVK